MLEYAYWQRMQEIEKNPLLEGLLTKEFAAKAAYIGLLADRLPDHAVARIQRLTRSEDDWDGKGAKAMTLPSLANFTNFFLESSKSPKDIGIFLNYRGEVLANWSLGDGSTIDIAFGDNYIEVVTDEYEQEFDLDSKEVYQLIARH